MHTTYSSRCAWNLGNISCCSERYKTYKAAEGLLVELCKVFHIIERKTIELNVSIDYQKDESIKVTYYVCLRAG